MTWSAILLPEFDQETAKTRATLERVPDDKLGWKPHPKSWAMGGIATHVANILTWARLVLEKDSFDLAPPGAPPIGPAAPVTSRQDLLATFDRNRAAAREALAAATDEQFMRPWTLLKGGKPIFTLPRLAAFRSFVMNHSIHHRAQLGVYLRLNDLPVPAIYGPSADEGAL